MVVLLSFTLYKNTDFKHSASGGVYYNPIKNGTKSSQQLFTASSLSNIDSTIQVVLTIDINTSGVAVISKTEQTATSSDKTRQFLVGNNLNTTIDETVPNQISATVNEILPNYSLYWIPIDLDINPVQSGGPTVTFYCKGHRCRQGESCDISAMKANNGTLNIICNNFCRGRCNLKSGGAGNTDNNEGGGVYVLASSVIYSN